MKRMWGRGVVAGALVVATLVGWAGGEDAKSDKLPADLAHVPTKALWLASMRPAPLYSSEAGKLVRQKMPREAKGLAEGLEEDLGVSPDKIERLTAVLRHARSSGPPLIFVGTTEKFDPKKVFAGPLGGGKQGQVAGRAYTVSGKWAGAVLAERAFVLGPVDEVRLVLSTTPDGKGDLAPAVRLAAGKHLAVVGVAPQALPPLPEDLPAEFEPLKPLLKAGIATATLDLDRPIALRLRLTFPDAEAAAAGVKAVEAGRKLGLGFLDQAITALKKEKATEGLAGQATLLRDGVKEGSLKREGNLIQGEVRVKMAPEVAAGGLLGGFLRVREAAARLRASNNLKAIALAFDNYEAAGGRLPAQAIYTPDGKPGLSWRVMLLPYLDQSELYKQFKLDEAWDSPHNKKLIARMPWMYEIPGRKQSSPGQTFFQVFHGKGAVFDGKDGIKFEDITDGRANTFLVVEAGKAVPWTKPEDIPFDPAKKLPRLGGSFRGVFLAAFCDGAVRPVSDTVSEDVLKAMITRNGGEKLGDD